MKRVISLFLVMILLMSVVAGCTTDDNKKVEETPKSGESEEVDNESAEGEIVKFGLGQEMSIANSKDGEDDKPATGQADVTIAAVGFDSDDKVVSVTIDTAQSQVEVDQDGKIVSELSEEVDTKKVLKDDYGMKDVSEKVGIGKEWYEQIEALEDWMIGKTVEEIVGMEVTERDESHTSVPDVEELTSSVTVTVEDYLAAVSKAWENAVDVEGGETVGLGSKTVLKNTKDAEDDKPAVVSADTTMTATTFDKDGNVVGTIIDVVQIAIEIEDGKVITDKNEKILTKHELKDDYGMKEVSEKVGIGKEWYEQAEALQEWMVGKSVEEIVGMEVTEKDESHIAVPDVEELTSSVTITVEEYLEVIQRASDNAR